MSYSITIIGERKMSNPETWFDVDVEVAELHQVSSATYDQPSEFEGGNVESITYKNVDVTDFILSIVSEEDVLFAIESKSFEIDAKA